ncbi:hypothetical protein [Ralstonia pseudosolanacearum]
MAIRKLFVTISLVLSILIFWFSFGQRIALVAEEDIQVTSLPDGGASLGYINVGQSVDVLECKDLKHYIVPKVRLPDRAEGYILQGKFHLIRHSAWQFSAGSLSFSCS